MLAIEEYGPVVQSLDDPAIELLDPVLRPCVRELGLGLGIKHPWVNHIPVMVGLANYALTAKVGMARRMLAERDWSAYLMVCVERPWRMTKLIELAQRGRVHGDELRELICSVWSDTEMPYDNLDPYEVLELFLDAGFVTDEPVEWDALPDELLVWRGGPEGGLSWTLDRSKAEWFATRFSQEHQLWCATIDKRQALAYITGRAESEVVLDPSDPVLWVEAR